MTDTVPASWSKAIVRELDVTLIVVATQRELTARGFDQTMTMRVATVVSELARNIWVHAGRGRVTVSVVHDAHRGRGVRVVAEDQGPGIPDVETAMTDRFSTAGTMGMGLPGTARLMHEIEIESEPGHGTVIRATRWERHRE